MPKLDTFTDQYNGSSSLTMVPAEGDIRESCGDLEKYFYGNWIRIGPGDFHIIEGNIGAIENHIKVLNHYMADEISKRRTYDYEIEDQFPDLAEAGEYLRMMKNNISNMEKAYSMMSENCKKQLETYATLEQGDDIMPGIDITDK